MEGGGISGDVEHAFRVRRCLFLGYRLEALRTAEKEMLQRYLWKIVLGARLEFPILFLVPENI